MQRAADVVAHALSLARNEGVNLQAAIEDKWLRRADPSSVILAS